MEQLFTNDEKGNFIRGLMARISSKIDPYELGILSMLIAPDPNTDEIIDTLRSQQSDCPQVMEKILGAELSSMLKTIN